MYINFPSLESEALDSVVHPATTGRRNRATRPTTTSQSIELPPGLMAQASELAGAMHLSLQAFVEHAVIAALHQSNTTEWPPRAQKR
jgi:hypothetical protein